MNEKLTLQDLVDQLALKKGIAKKDAELFLKEFFSVLTDTVCANEPVKIKEFGTFRLTTVSRRESVDVNTGDKIEIPAHYRLSFQPDKDLKEIVNKPFASFESILLEGGDDKDNMAFELPSHIATSLLEPENSDVNLEINEDTTLPDTAEVVEVEVQDVQENLIVEETIEVAPESKEEQTSVDESKPAEVIEISQPEIAVPKIPKVEIRSKMLKDHPDSVHLTPSFEYSYSTTLDAPEGVQEILSSIKNKSKEIISENIVDTTPVFEESLTSDVSEKEIPPYPPVKELEQEEGLSRNLLSENGEEVTNVIGENEEKQENVEDETAYDDIPEFYSYQPSFWTMVWRRMPLILFVIIILGMLTYAFLTLFDVKYDSNYLFGKKAKLSVTADSLSDEIDVLALDSVAEETSKRLDSLKRQSHEENKAVLSSPAENIPNVKKAESKLLSQKPAVATDQSVEKETIKVGSTLRSLANQYYGSNIFWVYIYEENKNIIDDPDAIPLGLKITIPKAEKYGINPKDVNSVNIAKEKGLDITRKLRQKRLQ